MWIAGGSILLLYGLLAVLSRREQGDLFHRMGWFLYKCICVYGLHGVGAGGVQRDLELLHPGESAARLKAEYYVEKIRMVLLIVLMGVLLSLLVKTKSLAEEAVTAEGGIRRMAFGEGERTVELQAEDGTGQQAFARLTLQERQLDYEAAESLYQSFAEALPELILGDNSSLEKVSVDLLLEEAWEGYPFAVVWQSSDYEKVSRRGRVYPPMEKTECGVLLTAAVTYAEWEWNCQIPVVVVQALPGGEETFAQNVQKLLETQEQETRDAEVFLLPWELDGREVVWREIREDNSLLFLALTIATAMVVFFMMDRDLHQKTEERKLQMKKAYPVILNKFTLYLGAGMTIRGAFRKIAADYEKNCREGKKSPVYGEMLYSCNELQAGVSEGAVYENFGRRSGVREYARFCTMLNQNLKKGNAALLTRLKEEREKALTEDMQLRKKQGEEAQTKLLAPMVMMMAIVMLLVMVPAFAGFAM